jgi:hypothetical protein
MSCEQVRNLLGRFHDGELSTAGRTAVELHLGDCATCAGELAAIAGLGEAARALCEPEPPADLWDRIIRRLGDAKPGRFPIGRVGWLSTVAALLCIAIAAGWWARKVPRPEEPQTPFEAFAENNEPAPDWWPAHTGRQQVSLQEAVRRVDFLVLADAQLPCGYCLQNCCLCREGCCDVVECWFARGREKLLLVQGGPDHKIPYGDRPAVEARINGKPARIVQCGQGSLAASWPTGGTALSLIGAQDVSELVQLVTFIDQHLDGKR